MSGYGTYRFADGSTYDGVMRDNWPDGEGTARYANGGTYVGRWKGGKYEVTPQQLASLKAAPLCTKELKTYIARVAWAAGRLPPCCQGAGTNSCIQTVSPPPARIAVEMQQASQA